MANGHRGGRRMQKHWHSIPGNSVAAAANGTFLMGTLALTGPFTVVRMLGDYAIGITSAPAALDEVAIAFGIGVVSSDAATVGPSALPDPFGEPDYPWLFWAEHWLFWTSTGTGPASAVSNVRRSFDIRSMRKLKPRESLIFVVQYADVVGTPPVQVQVASTRVLVAD